MYPFLVSIRIMIRGFIVFLICLLMPTFSSAKDFRGLYPIEKLQRVQSVYGKNIQGVLYKDIHRYLLPNERRSLSEVTLNIPIFGNDAGLFEYYMNLNTGVMTIPALSIKFFDDLAIAFAWYEKKKLDNRKIIEYVARLYLQQDYLQQPSEALGVPEQAWKLDSYVDDVSQKTLKSGLAFLLIHELGHWHYRHSRYDSISNKQAQAQEKQSDAIALDVMARMHTIPYGIVPWFLVTGLLQGNPTTHPLSADRLYAIASKIENKPAIFIAQENVNTLSVSQVLSVATSIRQIADDMNKVRR